MISDLDIYRSANVLIREHGKDAALEAAQRADAMLEKGDLGGQAVWKRIVRAAWAAAFAAIAIAIISAISLLLLNGAPN